IDFCRKSKKFMPASYNKRRALALQVLFFFTSALEEAIQARERTLNSGQNESPSTVQPPACFQTGGRHSLMLL
ncbi:MAG: hypothetical protein PUH09_05855, partial [Eubacteriales bacterium]|nr:hypothetical protein [Eubacteriales bacterium]